MIEDARDALDQEILRRLHGAKRKHYLIDKLANSLRRPRDEVEQAIDRLVNRGELLRMRKGRVALPKRLGLVTGIISLGRGGRAVVVADDGDVPIALPRGAVRPAMHGDVVLVEVEPYRRRGLRTGKIHKILERKTTTLVGSVEDAGEHFGPVFVPAGRHSGYLGTVHAEGISAKPGEVVAGTIIEYPTSARGPVVRIERVLGKTGTLPAEIEATCHTLGIRQVFDAAVEREAERFAEPGEEAFAERLDLRRNLCVTIDPVGARDFDDAVCVERRPGGFRLIVSIADVAHYVRPGTVLDLEALDRGTSVYFPGRCVPMLPERISSQLASLLPGVDRLTVSAILELNADGEVIAAEFSRSVIRSRERLTYEQAQAIIDGRETADPQTVQALSDMTTCARSLHEQRIARGAVDLDLPEAVVRVDSGGHPIAIERRPRLWAHRIVEEFMLAANEAVARRLEAASLGFLYRIHERPDVDAMQVLAARLSFLGLRLARDGAMVSPRTLQAVVAQADGTAHERLVNLLVLRSMTRARYSAFREIHFGLASDCYTHFTSPIRRYPDLVVHRALCALLEGRVAGLASAESLAPVADQCSDRERRAMEAEREVDRAAAVIFMQEHVGRAFHGTVTTVDRYGFWVELDEAFVEGFVPVGRLDEYYEFVSDRMELRSRTSGRSIRTGEQINVRVVVADLTDRRLEFEPVRP